MEILNQFGVNWMQLAAQVFNFGLLLFILNKLLYKPILKILKTRQETIAKSLKQAQEIEQRLQKTQEEKDRILTEASKEGQKVINEATEVASQLIADAQHKALEEMAKIMEEGQITIKLEREKMQQEIKEELADLVASSLQRVLQDSLDKESQKKIAGKALQKL